MRNERRQAHASANHAVKGDAHRQHDQHLFAGATGFSYQVQYKNKLTEANWTNVGSVIVGNNTIQSINDATSEDSRFYRAQISQP